MSVFVRVGEVCLLYLVSFETQEMFHLQLEKGTLSRTLLFRRHQFTQFSVGSKDFQDRFGFPYVVQRVVVEYTRTHTITHSSSKPETFLSKIILVDRPLIVHPL